MRWMLIATLVVLTSCTVHRRSVMSIRPESVFDGDREIVVLGNDQALVRDLEQRLRLEHVRVKYFLDAGRSTIELDERRTISANESSTRYRAHVKLDCVRGWLTSVTVDVLDVQQNEIVYSITEQDDSGSCWPGPDSDIMPTLAKRIAGLWDAVPQWQAAAD